MPGQYDGTEGMGHEWAEFIKERVEEVKAEENRRDEEALKEEVTEKLKELKELAIREADKRAIEKLRGTTGDVEKINADRKPWLLTCRDYTEAIHAAVHRLQVAEGRAGEELAKVDAPGFFHALHRDLGVIETRTHDLELLLEKLYGGEHLMGEARERKLAKERVEGVKEAENARAVIRKKDPIKLYLNAEQVGIVLLSLNFLMEKLAKEADPVYYDKVRQIIYRLRGKAYASPGVNLSVESEVNESHGTTN